MQAHSEYIEIYSAPLSQRQARLLASMQRRLQVPKINTPTMAQAPLAQVTCPDCYAYSSRGAAAAAAS